MPAVLPLEGITVVALEQAVAAPFASRQLADLGARVIKIERVGVGDFARGYDGAVHGQSSYFVWLNRGKESICLDVKQPADLAVLRSMLRRADVFLHNLLPGAVDRLGLGSKAIRTERPDLITCEILGYGHGGPYGGRKAYDLLVQCESGLMSLTGTAAEPAKVGVSIADIAAGMYAYTGILTALYERRLTGVGSSVSVSMLEALGEWVTQPYLYGEYGDTANRRSGARHPSIAPYGPYRVGGGATVFLGIQNEREWEGFCREVLERPELAVAPSFATNRDRVAHDGELTVMIEAALADRTAEQVEARLAAIGVAAARMRTTQEFGAHPQLAARNRWRTSASPAGEVRMLLPPVTVPGREPRMGAVPALGEHTAALREEFAPIQEALS